MEVRKSQKNYLEHITPSEIQSESLAALTLVEKVMTAHVYVDRYYPRSAGWRERFKRIVDRSNEVLLKYLDLRIEIKEFREWDRRSSTDNIDNVVDELAMAHSCDEADWVIGLVRPVTGVTSDLHTVGVARLLSCHFVLRGLDTSAELEALQGMFLVTDKEAQEVYDKRLVHKEMSIFLHELAHTLGAIHTVGTDTLLHPYYSRHGSGFAQANVELMKLGLEERSKKDRALNTPSWASLWQAKIKEIGWKGWSQRSLQRFVNQESSRSRQREKLVNRP